MVERKPTANSCQEQTPSSNFAATTQRVLAYAPLHHLDAWPAVDVSASTGTAPSYTSHGHVVVHLLDPNIGGSGREASYGAICTLNNLGIMVCNDTMVGKLTVKWLGFTYTGTSLADFTQNNCPPGG
jgi:hypothetical protein